MHLRLQAPTLGQKAVERTRRCQPAAASGRLQAATPRGRALPRSPKTGGFTVCKAAATADAEVSSQNSTSGGSSNNGASDPAAYLTSRTRTVQQHWPEALGLDDFLARLEIALYAYGFTGDNTIAVTNVCRDEITAPLKNKVDQVFGYAFNTNGLGGVLTCGVTGMGAGLSHSPISGSGKERYVFLSFPHIAIDASGSVGDISRPGRAGMSCACGALIKGLSDIQKEGLASNSVKPGVHDAKDPEYSILKQRLTRRLRYEGASEAAVAKLNLVDFTKLAERTITDDLEYLIQKAVDPSKADYAVVTGVQIHNWGKDYNDEDPNLEYVAPRSVYVVINGERTYLNLHAIPPMTPRQIERLAVGSGAVGGSLSLTGVSESDGWPWQSAIVATAPDKVDNDNSTIVDECSLVDDPSSLSPDDPCWVWQHPQGR